MRFGISLLSMIHTQKKILCNKTMPVVLYFLFLSFFSVPTVFVGYKSKSQDNPSFGFTVVQNNGDSTTSWTGQCHKCDGKDVLMTHWIRTDSVNHCKEDEDRYV